VLVLRYFADLPASEVARILDCSPGTIKSSTSRGLQRLREALDPAASLSTADDTSPN
jgi:DNA-directed RNA polymerase specialized sigma24 family protein